MKKIFIILLMSVLLVGCSNNGGGSEVTPPTPPTPPSITEYTIKVVNKEDTYTYEYELNEIFTFSILEGIDKDSNFEYWYYIDNNKEVKVESNITVTKDLTIYAKYEGTTGTLPWV